MYSRQDILRYAENVKFVHSQLWPAHHDKHWHRFFDHCLTLCNGTPVRLSAMI